jgi:ABC-type antimicrobial peptide transport system permease subunit
MKNYRESTPRTNLKQAAPKTGARKFAMLMLGWQRFKRNITGLFGLTLVRIVFFFAIFGPFIAPYHPDDQSAMLELRSKSFHL